MHVNYRRGETRAFVFRREHGKWTHATFLKDKRDSWKPWKQIFNRRDRRHNVIATRLGGEFTPPRRDEIHRLM
jgi:hypothetical protein